MYFMTNVESKTKRKIFEKFEDSNDDDDNDVMPLQHIDDIQIASDKFRKAVREGDVRKIRRYLRRYANDLHRMCISTDTEGWSVMTLAAECGIVEVMTLLIKSNLPVHWQDANGWMPLHCATHRGHEAMVRFLINAPKMNLDYKSKHGWTALHIAVCKVCKSYF